MTDVAGEFSCAQDPDRLRLLAGLIDKLDFTGLDDKKVGIAIATTKQRVPRPKRFRRCARITPKPRDLRLAQYRKSNRV